MKNRPRPASNFNEQRRAAIEEVRAIYREVDGLPLQRSCTRLTECCHFSLTGRTPYLTRGEALLAAHAVRASGRKGLPESQDGKCPLLSVEGKCLVYQDRPFGCRTHFCAAAGGPISRGAVLPSIRKLEELDQRLGGTGPRALPEAVREELGG